MVNVAETIMHQAESEQGRSPEQARSPEQLRNLDALVSVMRADAIEAVGTMNTRASAYTGAINRLGEHLPPRTAAALHELMTTKLQQGAANYDQLISALQLSAESPANDMDAYAQNAYVPEDPIMDELAPAEPKVSDLDVARPTQQAANGPQIHIAA